jgi:hypothetical protein
MTDPTPTDWRALCAELLEPLAKLAGADPHHKYLDLITRARTALAQPEPQGPTDEELMALAVAVFEDPFSTDKDYARAVLSRWGCQ